MNISINKHLVVYEEEDEIILLNLVANNFYALDNISSIFWNQIKEGENEVDIVASISSLFEVSKERVTEDLQNFLISLEKAGVITIET